ncbi:MAG: hypothetical protein COZ76_01875, partial [Flavobacteriales bacterium CG_4_8_14_3_um_filter_35_10]
MVLSKSFQEAHAKVFLVLFAVIVWDCFHMAYLMARWIGSFLFVSTNMLSLTGHKAFLLIATRKISPMLYLRYLPDVKAGLVILFFCRSFLWMFRKNFIILIQFYFVPLGTLYW